MFVRDESDEVGLAGAKQQMDAKRVGGGNRESVHARKDFQRGAWLELSLPHHRFACGTLGTHDDFRS